MFKNIGKLFSIQFVRQDLKSTQQFSQKGTVHTGESGGSDISLWWGCFSAIMHVRTKECYHNYYLIIHSATLPSCRMDLSWKGQSFILSFGNTDLPSMGIRRQWEIWQTFCKTPWNRIEASRPSDLQSYSTPRSDWRWGVIPCSINHFINEFSLWWNFPFWYTITWSLASCQTCVY